MHKQKERRLRCDLILRLTPTPNPSDGRAPQLPLAFLPNKILLKEGTSIIFNPPHPFRPVTQLHDMICARTECVEWGFINTVFPPVPHPPQVLTFHSYSAVPPPLIRGEEWAAPHSNQIRVPISQPRESVPCNGHNETGLSFPSSSCSYTSLGCQPQKLNLRQKIRELEQH